MTNSACSIEGDKSKASVRWIEGKHFLGVSGKHSVIIDQKINEGGNDIGFKPTELLLLSLGGCLGTTILSMAEIKEIKIDDLRIDVEIERLTESTEDKDWKFTIKVHLEGDINAEEKQEFIRNVEEICKISGIVRNRCEVQAVLVDREE